MTTKDYDIDPREKIYNVVKSKGYYTKSFDDFKSQYSNQPSIDNLYDFIAQKKLYTKPKEAFYSQYFPEPVKKKEGGSSPLPSDGEALSKKIELFPLTYKREKEQMVADIRTPEQKTKAKGVAPLAAGFTQVQKPTKDETFSVEITDKEAEEKAYESFKSGEHIVSPDSQDPVGELSQQINIKKYSYTDYKVARKKVELLNNNFFSTGQEAEAYLEANQDKPDTNLTKQLAAKRYDEFKKVETALNDSNSLEEAAVKLAAANGDEQVKYLLEKTGGNLMGFDDETSPIPMAMRGEKLLQFLMNRDLRQLAEKNPQLKQSIKEEEFNFPVRHPEYATKLLAEAIANRRDEKGLNSSFANIVSKESTDKVVAELIEDGTLPANYQFLYEREVRPKLGTFRSIGRGIGNAIPGLNQLVNEAPIPTPGLLESLEQGFENTQIGIAKSIVNLPSVVGLPTLTDAIQPGQQQTFNILKKQYQTPTFEPSRFHQKLFMHGGGMAAFVAGIGGGTGVLRGTGLIKNPGLANATMMVLATHGDNQDKAKALFPRNDFKQFVYTSTMDGLNAAMGRFLPGHNIPRLLSKGEETVAGVLKKMVDGEITTSAAKNQIMEWFGNTAKSTLGGAEFMGAISAADDMLTQTLEGKNLNLDQTLEAGWEGFKMGLIATPILGGFEAALRSNKGFRDQIISMAENSDYYKRLAEVEATKDPEFAKIKDDVIKNLDYVGDVYKEIDGTNMTGKEKQTYLLNSLSERIKLSKAEAATDPTIKKKFQQQAKDISEVKDAALNGIPEEKVKLNQAIRDVKELYNEGYLSKGAKESIESKKTEEGEPKFDENKVNTFLKELAQQSNNITEDGKFNEGSDARKSVEKQYPKSLIELANEMFPEYRKTAAEYDSQQQTTPTEVKTDQNDFYNTYRGVHKDMRSGETSNETKKSIQDEGFREAFNVNAMPLTEDRNASTKKGQMIYLIPEKGLKDSANGLKVKTGWKPKDLEVFPIEYDGQPIHEAYLNNAKKLSESEGQTTPIGGEPNVVPSTSVIMPEEINRPQTTTIATKETTPDVKPKISIILPKSETNGMGEVVEVKPTISEPPKGGGVFSERPPTELSHRGLQEVANEFSLPAVKTRDTKSDIQLRQDARETVNDWAEKGQYGKNIERLIEKAENDLLSDKERVILEGHLANVSQELREIKDKNSPEFDAKLAEIKRLKDAGERTRSELGAALRIPVGGSRPKDITDFLVEEMDSAGVDKLTPKQKETVVKEYEDLEKAQQDFDTYKNNREQETTTKKAETEFTKTKATTKKTKKTHEDFVRDRKSLKEELAAARKEHEDWLKEQGIQKMGFGSLTTKEAKVIAKMVRSYADEGIVKLKEVVEKVLEEVKGVIPSIEERDIRDVIAGAYNEKKQTRNQLAATIVSLRKEQIAIDKLDKLEKSGEPVSETKKVKRNKQLSELRKQVKETDADKLAKRKENIKTSIAKIESQIREGDFAPPEKKPPIKLDEEGHKLRDKLIKLQQTRDARIVLLQRQNEGGRERALRLTAEISNIPRTLMTIGDFSGLLRQNLFFSVGHPMMTAQATPGMFKSFTSQKIYDRWFADLKESPRYEAIKDSKLAIADSLSHDLSKREEAFMSSLAEKIPLGVGKIVKGSERSYTMLLNKMRVDVFNYFADKMEARGLTAENSPKVYKAMAEYINNATGRSDFGKTLNRVAPVLNSVFFSPRLIASRINMLTYWAQPRFWKTLPKEARIDYFRNWGSLLAVGGTILALAKLGGADVEDDPRSSDFGKIKDGNTRWDIWGGAQPYIRTVAQLWTGERKSTKSGKIYELNGDDIFGETRGGVVADFFRNKLAPVPGAAVDILSGRTGIGEKIIYEWGGAGDKEISIDQYVKERLLPMTVTGTQEAVKDRGWKALFDVGVPQIFGVGTQTYDSKPSPSTSNSKPKKETKSKTRKQTKQDQ